MLRSCSSQESTDMPSEATNTRTAAATVARLWGSGEEVPEVQSATSAALRATRQTDAHLDCR